MGKEIESDEFKKLITLGEEKGFLTYDDVNDLLPSDVISSDQIDDIIMLFGEKNIDIIDTDKGEKLVVKKATEERIESKREDIIGLLPAIGKTGDPVKMYLREMGLVSLLSREGEVEIAKVIEEGAQESMEAVFSVNSSLKDVVNIGAQLKSGEIRVKSVVDNLDDEDGIVEEDMHRERVIKLLNKVTVFDAKNDVIRKKLNAKGLSLQEREKLKVDLDKNLLNIVKTCRKVRFSRRQIDRMVANLRVYLTEVEQAEESVRRCKKETGSFVGPAGRSLGEDAQVCQKRGAGGQKSTGVPGKIEILREDCPGCQPPVQADCPGNGALHDGTEEGHGGNPYGREKGGDRKEKACGGESASCRQHREEIYEPGPSVPGSDPGREYRVDEGR